MVDYPLVRKVFQKHYNKKQIKYKKGRIFTEIEVGKKYRGKINGAIVQIKDIKKDRFGNEFITFTDEKNNSFQTTVKAIQHCLLEEI